MGFLRYILLRPVSWMYGVVVLTRNWLFDNNILKSHSFPFPVICVGNISAGGTGKTPHVEYIARLLSMNAEVAVLSRGYLRRSRGFRIVTPEDSVMMSGDEPLQISRRLPGIVVSVDRDRVHGINELKRLYPNLGAVVMDDGFQHRSVRAGLNILLTSHGKMMTRDHLLPYGRLREKTEGKNRAQVIIVTKTPDEIGDAEMKQIRQEIDPEGTHEVFFTSLTYGRLRPLFQPERRKNITANTSVLLVTGIADPSPLVRYLESISGRVTHLAFNDHHMFSKEDISAIASAFNRLPGNEKIIVTTEKDSVRLKEIINIAVPVKENICCLPVNVRFIEREDIFIKILTDYAGKNR